jgi:hypothetical protein
MLLNATLEGITSIVKDSVELTTARTGETPTREVLHSAADNWSAWLGLSDEETVELKKFLESKIVFRMPA